VSDFRKMFARHQKYNFIGENCKAKCAKNSKAGVQRKLQSKVRKKLESWCTTLKA